MSRSTKGHHLNKLHRMEPPMLHTKFQGHLPFRSWEEDPKVLFFFPYDSIYNLVSISPVVSKWMLFENADDADTDDERWLTTVYSINTRPRSLWLWCGRLRFAQKSSLCLHHQIVLGLAIMWWSHDYSWSTNRKAYLFVHHMWIK